MERHLNLIKTDYQEVEKRVFPRFPFSYLTFKAGDSESKVFEVKDISFLGMQLCLKDGGHDFIPGTEIDGTLHWKGATLKALGNVKWVRGQQLGVAFTLDNAFEKKRERIPFNRKYCRRHAADSQFGAGNGNAL